MSAFSDLTDEDVTRDPLVVMPACQHAFLMSTLDGILTLDSYYKQNGDGWVIFLVTNAQPAELHCDGVGFLCSPHIISVVICI